MDKTCTLRYCLPVLLCAMVIILSPIAGAEEQNKNISVSIVYSGAPEANIYNSLIENYGFFEKNGLTVTPSYYPTGKESAERVMNGEYDFGVVPSFSVARLLNEGKKPIILTSVVRIDEIYYITVNKKAGITSAHDLKGKKVGIVSGDSWEYFLGKYMTLNGEDISSVTLIPLPNEKTIIEELVAGEIDAGLTIYQYASALSEEQPDTFEMWSVNNFENNYMLLICTSDTLTKNPEAIERLIKSFVDSWAWYNNNSDRVQKEMGIKGGLTEKQMKDLVSGLTPEVSLTQGLLSTMESQSRYLLKTETNAISDTPDYLEIIDFSFLDRISPEGDTIIHK